MMGMNLHRGVVDIGFLGALEVDRYGNINTTLSKEEPAGSAISTAARAATMWPRWPSA